jgi:hypothetical protein
MDISNKTLSLFVLAALIVSLVSVTITLNRISQVQTLTGFASSGSGNISVTILTATDITVLNNTINFGTGVVNSTNDFCENATLHTNGTGSNGESCWINATESMLGTGYAGVNTIRGTGIVIRNDGNKNLSITMDSAWNTAAAFLGGHNPSPEYNYTTKNEEANSCPSIHLMNWWEGISANTSMDICRDLKWADTADTVNMSIRIVFSANASGFKEDNLTFTAAVTAET